MNEELYSEIINNDIDGVIYYKAVRDNEGAVIDFKYQFLNKRAIEVIGLPREKFERNTFKSLNIGRSVYFIFDMYKKAFENGERVDGDFYHEDVHMWINYYIKKYDDGILVYFRDITERKNLEENLRNLLNEKDLIIKESNHRIKNNLQLLQSMLHMKISNNFEQQIKSELSEVVNHLNVISIIHDKLFQENSFSAIDLSSYLDSLIKTIIRISELKLENIHLTTNLEPIKCSGKFAVNIGLFVNELLTNSIKYAFPNGCPGTIEIELKDNGETICVCVDDNGIGYNPDTVRENSLGMQLIYSLADQLDGELKIKNKNGTKVSLIVKKES